MECSYTPESMHLAGHNGPLTPSSFSFQVWGKQPLLPCVLCDVTVPSWQVPSNRTNQRLNSNYHSALLIIGGFSQVCCYSDRESTDTIHATWTLVKKNCKNYTCRMITNRHIIETLGLCTDIKKGLRAPKILQLLAYISSSFIKNMNG